MDQLHRHLSIATVAMLCLVLYVLLVNAMSLSHLKQGQTDRWSGADMRRWADEFKHANPRLRVPEPQHKE